MINLITPLPYKWYDRINLSTALLSATIGLMYLVLALYEPPSGKDSWGVFFPTAIASLTHVIYAAIVFNLLTKKRPSTAGLVSYILFAVMAATLVHTSKDEGTIYVGMWTIVVLLGGMFGWFVLGAITALSAVYYFLLANNTIAAASDFNETVLFLVLMTSVVSFFLWRNVRNEQNLAGGDGSDEDIAEKLNSKVLIDSIVDGVVLVSSNKNIQVFNPAATRISGWETKEAIGLDYRSVLKFYDDKDQPFEGEQNPIARCLLSGKPVEEHSIILKGHSGKSIELDLIVSPIKASDNHVLAAMLIFRDVSKQRGEERQRAEFISTASHEMRTPVAAIEGYLALAMNDRVSKIDSAARGYLEKAHASTKHLGKLFQDLLTAAKSEDGRLSSHPVVIEVGVLLRDVIDRARFAAEKKGVNVKYKVSTNVIDTTKGDGKIVEPIYYIHADPDRLREVIGNIFDNAVKYTDEGQITVGMGKNAENIVITITDTGPGIAKEDIPHLFQKFYRIDSSDTRQVGGTGLGLFITKKIVELYKGKVWVESVLGKGSTFYISIPELPADKAKQMLQQEEAQGSPLDNDSPLPHKSVADELQPGDKLHPAEDENRPIVEKTDKPEENKASVKDKFKEKITTNL